MAERRAALERITRSAGTRSQAAAGAAAEGSSRATPVGEDGDGAGAGGSAVAGGSRRAVGDGGAIGCLAEVSGAAAGPGGDAGGMVAAVAVGGAGVGSEGLEVHGRRVTLYEAIEEDGQEAADGDSRGGSDRDLGGAHGGELYAVWTGEDPLTAVLCGMCCQGCSPQLPCVSCTALSAP